MLEHRDGILVWPSIMRQREAMQVEIVGLRILWTRAGIEKTAGDTERRQQPLTHLGRYLRLQRDQVLSRGGHVGLPQKLVAFHLNRLKRNQNAVALLHEVSGN